VHFKRGDGAAQARWRHTETVARGIEAARVDNRDKRHQLLEKVRQIIHEARILRTAAGE
jgi:hypothetical protein